MMIREYKERDQQQIIDIWYSASAVAHSFLSVDFMKKEEINIRNVYLPNTKTWVYESETIDGFISMLENEVGAIFVRPEMQNKGIGKSLMEYVSQFHSELEVEVFKKNVLGRRFYEHYGFKVIKEYLHNDTQQQMLRMKCKTS